MLKISKEHLIQTNKPVINKVLNPFIQGNTGELLKKSSLLWGRWFVLDSRDLCFVVLRS